MPIKRTVPVSDWWIIDLKSVHTSYEPACFYIARYHHGHEFANNLVT